MTESVQVERAARAAIARAKARGDENVTPDDLLEGALAQVSRFGIAWIGPWPIDMRDRDDGAAGDGGDAVEADPADDDGLDPAATYTRPTVRVFERATALAREDGSASTGLIHLLAALADEDCDLMAEIRERHGFSSREWRATLARGAVGVPSRFRSDPADIGAGGDGGRAPDPEILSVDEAADYLDVHSQTVRNYIRGGKLPAYRLAGERYIRVLRKDLLALLERVPTDVSDEDEES